jgi:nucleotide-binding universal stress UspA family protein
MATKAQAYLIAFGLNLVADSVCEGRPPQFESEQSGPDRLLAEGVELLRDLGVGVEGSMVQGDPIVHIPRIAKAIGADLIVVGARLVKSRRARCWSEC